MERTDHIRIAAQAGCDPRTVAKRMNGEFVRTRAREAIEQAAEALGYNVPPMGPQPERARPRKPRKRTKRAS